MSAYKWVHVNAGEPAPPRAVIGGRDCDGCPIYVSRSHHEGDNIPAKFIPDRAVAYVAYAGQEHPKPNCEVLVRKEFEWVPSYNGSVPPEAVPGGNTSSGETLYIGRVNHNGSMTVGKIQPSHGCLYISFGGQELSFTDYEILVLE